MWVELFLGYALVVFECFRHIQNVFLELCTCALELRQGVTQFHVHMLGGGLEHCMYS